MTIGSHFTQQEDVRQIILEHLDKASDKVLVAVAWFTDAILFEKLLELQDRGISVEVIITKHEFNTQCSNDYSLLVENGFFAEIGSDQSLMHMKFCVIDFNTVISGSANWSNRAFTENNEEVTIVSGNQQRANDFIEEFERLKTLSGQIQQHEKELELAKIFDYFDLIRALLKIGDTAKIQPYIHELKVNVQLKTIKDFLLSEQYDSALVAMDEFQRNQSQLFDIGAIQKAQLITQIKLLSLQIETLETEKNEIEALIDQFNHRYIIELNPLITRILKLKKKIYDKLKRYGIIDETYQNIENEFNQKNSEYEEQVETPIPDLNERDEADIRQMHRDAVKLCHPDSTSCIYGDKDEASRVFAELTKAFKKNDIERVRAIWDELKKGHPITNLDEFNEIDQLKAKLESLNAQYKNLIYEISNITASDIYQQIISIDDWSAYFESEKMRLIQEYESLNEKFVNHE